MELITLAVSPLVRAILLSRYDGQPIEVHRSDALYFYLQGDPVRVNATKFRRLNKELTERVTLRCSTTLYKRLSACKRYITVGYHLHKVFQQEMLTYMLAQHRAGVPAQAALKEYFALNGITEDDYALDSAYSVWKRKKDFYNKKAVFSMSQNEQICNCKNDRLIPIDPRDVLQSCNAYFKTGLPNLTCSHHESYAPDDSIVYLYDEAIGQSYIYARKVCAYLLHIDAQLTGVEISNIIRLTPRTIQRYIASMRFQVEHYSDLQHDIRMIRAIYQL
jgi:hypothetical protein